MASGEEEIAELDETDPYSEIQFRNSDIREEWKEEDMEMIPSGSYFMMVDPAYPSPR